MARLLRDLAQLTQQADDMHANLIEILRDQGVTWEDIGELYEPPKSRQMVAKWMATRRRRRG